MAVTRDDVLKIAALANLHFAEEEMDAFTHQFQLILEYIAKLSEVDVSGVNPPATSRWRKISTSTCFARMKFKVLFR